MDEPFPKAHQIKLEKNKKKISYRLNKISLEDLEKI